MSEIIFVELHASKLCPNLEISTAYQESTLVPPMVDVLTQWCKIKFTSPVSLIQYGKKIYVFFTEKDDATLFKLTWG